MKCFQKSLDCEREYDFAGKAEFFDELVKRNEIKEAAASIVTAVYELVKKETTKMRVLVFECGKPPRVAEVEELHEMQQIVGGAIQAIYPWEDQVALVCNDEGVLLGMPRNVEVPLYGWVHGTFFICGLGEEEFISLTEEQVEKYSRLLL